ncbi:MAG: hypothetical protein GIX00_09145 [Candidatus Eremiobacteraeota bacterium]|nr:hypothetical protein [Candidatus Eremiobacteraeota bacterium]
MMPHTPLLLVLAVIAVGVLHTLVPDHWAPITLMARQRGWSRAQTAKAAVGAGLGHTISTLIIAVIVWTAGVAFATKFGGVVNLVTSLALIGFGGWVAIGAIWELREQGSDDGHRHHQHNGHGQHTDHGPAGHAHLHKHGHEITHVHWHSHQVDEWHEIEGNVALAPPLHQHEHSTSARTAMLLVLGSSPMVEGIPAFFAAAKYGAGLLAVMSILFALSTIATYVLLCVSATAGLQKINLGPFERYGEVISGVFIALLGLVFLFIH